MKIMILSMVLSVSAIALTGCQTATDTSKTNADARANVVIAQNSNANSVMNTNGGAMVTDGHSNMSEMSETSEMSGMKSSPNAASAPYDLQFLDTMTHHHQGALDMAKTAVEKTNNQELKTFARKIIVDQKKEIALMKDWREKWFARKPSAMNMEMSGMNDSMKMMMGDEMKRFEAAAGKEFDLMFLDLMTPHHAGATTMAKEALTRAEQPEIKTLANQIIKAQEEEIEKMSDWKAKWAK